MYNITSNSSSVTISDGTKTWVYPKGTLTAHADSGDNQSVDIKLMGSRKLIHSFPYNQSNIAGASATEVATALANII